MSHQKLPDIQHGFRGFFSFCELPAQITNSQQLSWCARARGFLTLKLLCPEIPAKAHACKNCLHLCLAADENESSPTLAAYRLALVDRVNRMIPISH